MKLVVDTNILVSFFRDNPVRFIIANSDLLNLELFSPQYALDELKNKEKDLLKYSKLDLNQLNEIFSLIKKFINIISSADYEKYMNRAKQICPDEKDIPFFALSLELNCALWSNEPNLKNQSEIKVYNTKDLKEQLKLKP